MKRALTAAEMRVVEMASAGHGVSVPMLMENAGQALAQAALAAAGPKGRFLVLCGLGNNGGDGLVAALRLHAQGRVVLAELMGRPEELQGEPARHATALAAAGVALHRIADELPVGAGDVVIDALLGTGLSRAPEGPYAEAIQRMAGWRATGAKVIAADVPSGLHSDSGATLEPCVSADVTVAFGFLKVGQALEPGSSRCGQLEVVDIGIPRAAEEVLADPPVFLLEEADVRDRLPVRRADAHKGTFGHVLIIAGSPGKTGAAALAGLAALRGGAGLVTVALREEALASVLNHGPELMGLALKNHGALGPADLPALLEAAAGKAAVVVGPGIPRGEHTGELLAAFLEQLEIPCVLDADALNALGGRPEVLGRAKGELVLTPHPGEMARLLGLQISEVQQDRVGVARRLAQQAQVVVALKGAHTAIARLDGTVFLNPTGNPGMATGGTGDVLAGLCGALLAQGLSSEDAAVVGCFAHGLAGDLAARRHGQVGLIASDLLEGLSQVWVRWGR